MSRSYNSSPSNMACSGTALRIVRIFSGCASGKTRSFRYAWWLCRWVRIRLWTAGTNGPVVYSFKWCMSKENHGEIISSGETPCLFTRALWHSCQQSSSNKSGGTAKEMMDFCLTKYHFHASKGSLTCRKISQGPTALLLLQRKACWDFLSPLKSIFFSRAWSREPWFQ
jgi:hypothetical protein